jgi:hypothetical protein
VSVYPPPGAASMAEGGILRKLYHNYVV